MIMKAYIDPYIDRKTGVLKNKKGIQDGKILKEMEADFTALRLKQLACRPLAGDFGFRHLCRMHEVLFQDLYEWAGIPRIIDIEKAEEALGGLSAEYTSCDGIQGEIADILSKMDHIQWDKLSVGQKTIAFSDGMAALWKVHPFREGNTRTVVTFCCDFAKSKGFGLNRELLKDNSVYLRRSLVAANAAFSDLEDLSRPEYLRKIIGDSMELWQQAQQKK